MEASRDGGRAATPPERSARKRIRSRRLPGGLVAGLEMRGAGWRSGEGRRGMGTLGIGYALPGLPPGTCAANDGPTSGPSQLRRPSLPEQ